MDGVGRCASGMFSMLMFLEFTGQPFVYTITRPPDPVSRMFLLHTHM